MCMPCPPPLLSLLVLAACADAGATLALADPGPPPEDVPVYPADLPPESAPTCATGCDDGRVCTLDECRDGACAFSIAPDACLIAGLCRAADEADPDDACMRCVPAASATAWTPAPDGTACVPAGLSPGPCEVAAGACEGGACAGGGIAAKPCDDGNACTPDSCDPDTGLCAHGKDDCDDGNPCTTDTCEPTGPGCRHTPAVGAPCGDHDACTIEDACTAAAKCVGMATNCDDGNSCTKDGCDDASGCFHEIDPDAPCCDGGVSWCDDGSPCTTDGCDPVTFECTHDANAAACDDADACTVNDSCDAGGKCKGVAKACSDGNSCTTDLCTAGECKNVPVPSGPCDDGLGCSTGDHCVAGACVADTSGCGCDPDFGDVANKLVKMWIEGKGHPGNGLDVDGNPATCMPESDCSAGIDNSLGPLGSFGGDSLQVGLDQGRTILVYEHRGLKTDGTPYTLAMYAGKLAPSSPGCDWQHDTCDYLVNHDNLTLDCKPVAAIHNARIVGDKLTAGGPGATVPFDMPLFGGVTLHVDMLSPRIEATVVLSGGKVVSMSGILGGGVPLSQLKQGLLDTPPQFWPPELPPPEDVVGMVDILVKPDIDGNGDGKPESASIGVHFEAIGANLVGVF
ncbi:MAG: hypothetical protein FJ087_04115 [Deltaproteobacteria bacterium]|nr:hypothetical protein [Deltaproteobacteria bacterium]